MVEPFLKKEIVKQVLREQDKENSQDKLGKIMKFMIQSKQTTYLKEFTILFSITQLDFYINSDMCYFIKILCPNIKVNIKKKQFY